jgi:hypothetical protein
MKTKIICILVMTLLITTAVSAMGMTNTNDNEDLILYQPSCDRAPNIRSEVEKTTKQSIVGGTPFYGYIAYDPQSLLTIGPCYFMPTTPGTLNSLAPTTSTDFLSGGTWANGVWYGCEYSFGSGQPLIWTINEITGVMTQIGSYDPGGTGLNLNGLAYDPTNNKLYGCSSSDLYTVSMTSGAATIVGPFGIGGELMIGIAFDSSGNLYGTDLVSDSLYTINPLSGNAALVGSLGIDINFAQDMAFDWDTGILYLSAFTIVPFEGALYTCNTGTGAATKVGSFENGADVTCFAIPTNNPPTAPIITGPTSGQPGVSYTWTFHSSDPDTAEIYYVVDWGDGIIETTGCMPPCTPHALSHTYAAQGTYEIKAKAVECPPGTQESAWSTFTVTIPRNKELKNPFLNFLQSHPNIFPIIQRIMQQLGLFN